ncbi:hypothetical protein G5B38_14515 [Pseudohalocynthiibacter aestuariivivens]|uniref:Uncharacterized protein n=1 Tax=Roseovarius pelagicus TaxID=2980108 RepID=A0ABY6DM32_9RHOB|nr:MULTISPECIES: hypothetical protein [Rhodobacterales]QIE46639.1 hypothetical protein G5B38_14515 [Pseudohalocynthiibacter aestuariivivens]UXX84830.1 hypothetical protein N7U68_09410 [Roseovarius pelagicus]
MSEFTLTKTRLFEGVWEGVLTYEGDGNAQPKIDVTHLGEAVDGVEVIENEAAAHWVLRVPIPTHMIADGVQTFLIRDTSADAVLGDFSLIAGEALAYDIRAEVTLLREELDMLKRAFRRHCLETM